MMFAFCSFSFPFLFLFFLSVEKYVKQTKPILTRIVGDTVQESCLFGGKRKDENYRGCYYSLNPLGNIVDFENRKTYMIRIGGN